MPVILPAAESPTPRSAANRFRPTRHREARNGPSLAGNSLAEGEQRLGLVGFGRWACVRVGST